jgi:hypothetical protein
MTLHPAIAAQGNGRLLWGGRQQYVLSTGANRRDNMGIHAVFVRLLAAVGNLFWHLWQGFHQVPQGRWWQSCDMSTLIPVNKMAQC